MMNQTKTNSWPFHKAFESIHSTKVSLWKRSISRTRKLKTRSSFTSTTTNKMRLLHSKWCFSRQDSSHMIMGQIQSNMLIFITIYCIRIQKDSNIFRMQIWRNLFCNLPYILNIDEKEKTFNIMRHQCWS